MNWQKIPNGKLGYGYLGELGGVLSRLDRHKIGNLHAHTRTLRNSIHKFYLDASGREGSHEIVFGAATALRAGGQVDREYPFEKLAPTLAGLRSCREYEFRL